MKRALSLLAILAFSAVVIAAGAPATQPDAIAINDKSALVAATGKIAAVSGEVSTAAWSAKGRVMVIKFQDASDSKFTAVVFSSDKDAFDKAFDGDAAKTFAGAKVSITGKLGLFHDNPQIVMSKPDQIKIQDPAASK